MARSDFGAKTVISVGCSHMGQDTAYLVKLNAQKNVQNMQISSEGEKLTRFKSTRFKSTRFSKFFVHRAQTKLLSPPKNQT